MAPGSLRAGVRWGFLHASPREGVKKEKFPRVATTVRAQNMFLPLLPSVFRATGNLYSLKPWLPYERKKELFKKKVKKHGRSHLMRLPVPTVARG